MLQLTCLSAYTNHPKNEIKNCNDKLHKEEATKQEAKKVLEENTDFTNQLAYKENDLLTQKVVYEKQKQLLGMDDMTQNIPAKSSRKGFVK